MRAEFFKESYEAELELKEKLNSGISSQLTLITIVGGVAAFYAHNYEFARDFVTCCFITFVICLGCTLGIAVFCLVRASTGYTYDHVSSGPELSDYYDTLTKYFTDKKVTDVAKSADEAFERKLNLRYTEATRKNARNNESKSGFMVVANLALAYGVAFAILAGIPYFIHFYQTKAQPAKVEITNFPQTLK